MAPAAEHEPGRARVRAAQLLAWPGLAGHRLAAVALAEPARLLRPRGQLRRDSLGQIATAGSSPSISSRSPASRSARRSSPGRPPSRWTGRPPITAAKQASRGTERKRGLTWHHRARTAWTGTPPASSPRSPPDQPRSPPPDQPVAALQKRAWLRPLDTVHMTNIPGTSHERNAAGPISGSWQPVSAAGRAA